MSEGSGPAEVGAAFSEAIEHELEGFGRHDLRVAAAALTQRYRSAGAAGDERRLISAELRAYLAMRVPATFAAARRVLAELGALRPGWAPATVLDLGAGPGTATWAAAAAFSTLQRAELIEREPEMAALGARLARASQLNLLADAEWSVGDAAELDLPESDLVLAAYVLGELAHRRQLSALQRWWGATRGELVLLEAGTPAGFERLRAARTALIGWGASLTAPCPHEDLCPMGGGDWCHFAVRLARSGLHRELKDAHLGYEDEKYAYLVVSRSRLPAPYARLVRSPRPRKGHVRLLACEQGGLLERVVTRRDGELYRRARAARWGDRLDPG